MTLLILAILSFETLHAQTPSHRMRLKYRIYKNKLNKLATRNITLQDATGAVVTPCGKKIKCLITNTNGVLTVDPWAVSDPSVNPKVTKTDPCLGKAGTVNAKTPYPLKIDIQRGYNKAAGTATLVGHPTEPVSFPYETWVIGVNTLGVKFRPRVTDNNGNEWSGNAITGSINAGFTIGYSFGKTKFTHRSTNSLSCTPAFSFGLASAVLAKEPLKKAVVTTFNPNNFILSPSLGIILSRNEIGVFVAYGHDYMLGKNSDAWAYQGKYFVGVGLSASFKL